MYNTEGDMLVSLEKILIVLRDILFEVFKWCNGQTTKKEWKHCISNYTQDVFLR